MRAASAGLGFGVAPEHEEIAKAGCDADKSAAAATIQRVFRIVMTQNSQLSHLAYYFLDRINKIYKILQ